MVIALLSLGVAGIPLVSALGLASAIAVVCAVLVAISLLPAFLGLLGPRVNRLALPAFLRPKTTGGPGMWSRWAGVVHRHPLLIAVLSVVALVPLIIPVFSLRLGQEDIGATSPDTTERQAYDLITAGFGVGYNGPLQVASALDPVATPSAAYTKKYDKAQSLQTDLENKQVELPKEQKQLEKQQKQLEEQQQSLERQKTQLENQQASLERQAAQLQAQQSSLEQQAAQLQQERRVLETRATELERRAAELRREAEALAARIRPLARELAGLEARERALLRAIERAEDRPRLLERLRARLAEVRAREAIVRQQLAPLQRRARDLAERGRVLRNQIGQLRGQAAGLAAEAAELERQKAVLEQQGADLQAQAAQLQAEGTSLQEQAAELQAEGDALQEQADELKAEQKQAQQEQKQAEKLKQQLTDMVTAAGGDPRGTDPRVVDLQAGLSATAGVIALTPPQINDHGDVVMLSAVPSTSPSAVETADLVDFVRATVLPTTNADGGIDSYVGGFTASYVDLATLITDRLLLVIGTVILLGFLLLMVAFRSLLIPLQAAITNLLSAAAAFGVLTAAFQWGWGISLLGIDTPDSSVPIASYVPLMMFAGLFGLSMDYEVFLVSHVEMHHHAGEEARQSVISGLGASARITTAAALIMTSVFASFILNEDPVIKQFGLGLATAVLLAGILVVTLAPAILVLFGRAAWWLPRWLDRILPHISIEGEAQPTPKPTPKESTPAAP